MTDPLNAEGAEAAVVSLDRKTAVNVEFLRLYEEGRTAGKHGHYECMFRAMHQAYAPIIAALAATPASTEGAVPEPVGLPIDTAPKDSTMLRLLVQYDHDDTASALEDKEGPGWTIGFNSLANTGEDEWHVAGWDWEQDMFRESSGTPIAWLPFHAALSAPHPALQAQIEALTEELDEWKEQASILRDKLQRQEEITGGLSFRLDAAEARATEAGGVLEGYRAGVAPPKDGRVVSLLLSSCREVPQAWWGRPEDQGGEVDEGWLTHSGWARGEDEEVIAWKPWRSPLSAASPHQARGAVNEPR